jgi:hypothetical protein
LFEKRAPRRTFGLLAGIAAITLVGGCDALNPSFVNVLLPSDIEPPQTAQAASGYIPIFFVSNAVFDGELLQYLEELGVDLENVDLRPRVRAQVFVQFQDGSTRTLEFLDGGQLSQLSTLSVDETGGETEVVAVLPPDLDRPPLNNQVMQCDVDLIDLDFENLGVEVYVPVFYGTFVVENVDLIGLVKRLTQLFQPQFVQLESDDLDASGDLVIVNNIDIRDIPGPINQITCGSVIAYVLDGTLRVPFVTGPFAEGIEGAVFPGWLEDDEASEANFPGRYRIRALVR